MTLKARRFSIFVLWWCGLLAVSLASTCYLIEIHIQGWLVLTVILTSSRTVCRTTRNYVSWAIKDFFHPTIASNDKIISSTVNGKTDFCPNTCLGLISLNRSQNWIMNLGRTRCCLMNNLPQQVIKGLDGPWRVGRVRRPTGKRGAYFLSSLLENESYVSLLGCHADREECGENVLYTILNELGKSKDHLAVRKDLQAMGIRSDAWPDENDKFSPASFM